MPARRCYTAILSYVFARPGFLLLRKDRPDWPGPFRLARGWLGAWMALMINVVCTVFGVLWMKYTGYVIGGQPRWQWRAAADLATIPRSRIEAER